MEVEELKRQHAGKIPIICIENNDYRKFLVPDFFTLNHFVFYYREKINLDRRQAIYVTVEGRNIFGFNDTLGDLYDLYKCDDNILYLYISREEYLGN